MTCDHCGGSHPDREIDRRGLRFGLTSSLRERMTRERRRRVRLHRNCEMEILGAPPLKCGAGRPAAPAKAPTGTPWRPL
jgi:hypothetical protein